MNDERTGIFARESPFLDRYVQIGVASGRVISLSFPPEPDEGAETDHEVLERIFAYLEGVEDDFADAPVALTVPTTRCAVLESVREIPYGEDATVAQVARMTAGVTDDDEGRAEVREALDANPVPLLIPDHRVRDGPSAAPPEVEQKLRSLENR